MKSSGWWPATSPDRARHDLLARATGVSAVGSLCRERLAAQTLEHRRSVTSAAFDRGKLGSSSLDAKVDGLVS
jgi:hypothetical protein